MENILFEILCIILLLAGIILVGSGRIVKGKTVSVLLFLTFFPPVLWIISIYFALFGWTMVLNISKIFIPILIIFQIVILMLILFIRWNINPYSRLSRDTAITPRLVNLDKSRKLLQLALYSSIINFIYSLPIIAIIIYWSTIVVITTTIPINSLTNADKVVAILFSFLRIGGLQLASLVYISIMIGTALSIIVYVLTINGTIRMIYASESIKENQYSYLLFMLLPIVNIISNYKLSRMAKKELINEGYKVGLFESQYKK